MHAISEVTKPRGYLFRIDFLDSRVVVAARYGLEIQSVSLLVLKRDVYNLILLNVVKFLAVGVGKEEEGTTEELASKCNSDPEFVQRIARAVASLGMLQEISQERYAHTPISMILRDDIAQASLAPKFSSKMAAYGCRRMKSCSPIQQKCLTTWESP